MDERNATKSEARKATSDLTFKRGLLPMLFFVLLLWIGTPFIVSMFYRDMAEKGQAGDLFGSINSLFAGLAFAGVIYSVRLQREDLRIVREDSERTKRVLEQQEANIEEQQRMARESNFEKTFFELLRVFTDLTSSLKVQISDPFEKRPGMTIPINGSKGSATHSGKDVFSPLIGQHDIIVGRFLAEVGDQITPSLDNYHSGYEALFVFYGHLFGHYFRTLYNILSYIEKAPINDKDFYSELIRAQLSEGEATLLMLNYISPRTTPQFNMLIDRYGMLKNANLLNVYAVRFSERINIEAFGKSRGAMVKQFFEERKSNSLSKFAFKRATQSSDETER